MMNDSSDIVVTTKCGLPEGSCEQLLVFQQVVLSINITCVSVTFILIIILQKYKTFSQRIFCNLLLTNFLSSLTRIGYDGSVAGPRCTAQGFFDHVFDMSTFMWIGGLTVFLFLKLIKSKDSEKYERVYIAVCWLVPIFMAILPLITMDYGPSSAPYCWIMETTTGTVWRYAAYWGPVFLGVVIILILFVYMIWHANRAIRQYSGGEFETKHRVLVRGYLKPLTAYSAAFVFLALFQLINRIHQIYNEPNFGLIAMHIFCLSIYGVVSCTLFIIFTGCKEFSPNKTMDALKSHKKRLTSKSGSGDVTEFHPTDVTTPESTLPRTQAEAAEKLSEPNYFPNMVVISLDEEENPQIQEGASNKQR